MVHLSDSKEYASAMILAGGTKVSTWKNRNIRLLRSPHEIPFHHQSLTKWNSCPYHKNNTKG